MSDTQKQKLNVEDHQEIWSAKDIADYIGYSERHVREKTVHEPGFPNRLSKLRRPRWIKADVIKYFTGR